MTEKLDPKMVDYIWGNAWNEALEAAVKAVSETPSAAKLDLIEAIRARKLTEDFIGRGPTKTTDSKGIVR